MLLNTFMRDYKYQALPVLSCVDSASQSLFFQCAGNLKMLLVLYIVCAPYNEWSPMAFSF